MSRTQSFDYGSGRITVKAPTVRDELNSEYLAVQIAGGKTSREFNLALNYARFVTSIQEVTGDVGFMIPAIDAPAGELSDGFNAWLDMPGLLDLWRTSVALAQISTRQELTPTVDPKGSAPASSGGDGGSSTP